MEREINPKAFPVDYETSGKAKSNSDNTCQTGMTLLDYFAAKAMQGIITHCSINKFDIKEYGVSEKAYKIALEMLKERQKHL